MNRRFSVHRDAYKDSVRLLEAARTMRERQGIIWASALMATTANMTTLAKNGFVEDLPEANANDLILAVCADSESTADEALDAAVRLLFNSGHDSGFHKPAVPADLRSALEARPLANLAVISVPGPYATLEAHKALTAGLHVFLFSDNVPIEDEIALKRRARELKRLVMGPGAGTALFGGAGLGFANRLAEGPVGVVAASGTGAQEVASLLDRWGVGISHIIGVGGRDMSDEVGGLGAEAAIRALDADDQTRTIMLVSKPPSGKVADRLLLMPSKPMVAVLIGLERPATTLRPGVTVCDTLEGGAVEMLHLLGKARPDPAASTGNYLVAAVERLAVSRKRLVGLFSGGTLCYEVMTVAARFLGPIHSNIPIDKGWSLEEAVAGSHICLDLGEEDYTRGNPHPVIDAAARLELLERQASDPSVAAVVLDVILGDGAHPDPASVLAPAVARVVRSGAAVVVHVLGTSRDPQGLAAQCKCFEDAGCIVAASATRAALAGAALVLRDPTIARLRLPLDHLTWQSNAKSTPCL